MIPSSISFVADLLDAALVRNPHTIHRTVCLLWNKAATAIPSWPDQRVSIPDRRRTFALAWSAFPATLKIDIDRYLERLAGKDLLAGDFRPLRPISVQNRAKLLRAFVSALVHRGRDPHSLGSLRDVVAVEVVKDGLRFFLDRAGGKMTAYIHEVAYVLTAIACHWVGVDPQHRDQLRAICKRLQRPNRGMSPKTRNRLRPFSDPENAGALLAIPERLLTNAARKSMAARAAALEIQTAVAIEFLLLTSLRISNLAGIDIERHLIRHRRGVMHLVIPGPEVKNDVEFAAVLPPHLVRMIDLYVEKHRPVLANTPSSWLFPGAGDNHKSCQSLRKSITKAATRFCGLDVNPHLYRSLSGCFYLEHHPGAYGVIRLLLGHKSVDTTTQYYCGMEATAAVRHYDEHILERRKQSSSRANRRARP